MFVLTNITEDNPAIFLEGLQLHCRGQLSLGEKWVGEEPLKPFSSLVSPRYNPIEM